MADSTRVRRMSERVQQIVALTLERRIKDPRLGFITITDVRMTGDLQHATIFYTVFGNEVERRNTAAALASARGIIRSEVGKGTGLRLTPTIEFVVDALPDTSREIEEALARARAADEAVAERRRGAQYAGDPDPYRDSRSEREENEPSQPEPAEDTAPDAPPQEL